MQHTLVQQGIDLMVYGMGTVFVFLALLVVGVSAMSRIVARFAAEEFIISPAPAVAVAAEHAQVDEQTLAIIQQAIFQHRAKRQG